MQKKNIAGFYQKIKFKINNIRSYPIFLRNKNLNHVNFFDFLGFIFSSIKGTHLAKHTFEVADLALALAQKAGLSKLEQSLVYWAAVLHDLGKVHLPDEIVLSPQTLADYEYGVVKLHPKISVEILSTIPLFVKKFIVGNERVSIADIALYHHEKINGTGYEGLSGLAIPKLARIIAIADAYAAMTDTARRFNRERSVNFEKVLERMSWDSGKQFDQELLDIFKSLAKESKGSIIPEYQNINEIFYLEGKSGPFVSISELKTFMEAFINKERVIEAKDKEGNIYTIQEIEEPYIISQMPDMAVINIYRDMEEVVSIIQEKEKLMIEEQNIIEELGLLPEDLKKASFFMESRNKKLFFTVLYLPEKNFKKLLDRFGSFTDDELRICCEDIFFQRESDQQHIKEIKENLITFLIDNGYVSKINENIYSINNVPLQDLAQSGLDMESVDNINKFILNKYVFDAEYKREKIFKKWLEIKAKAINFENNKLDEQTLEQVLPFIDYIPKVNFRGVPLRKLKYIVNGVVDQYIKRDYKKDIITDELYDALILYYFIEVVTLLDKYFLNLGDKNTEFSKARIKDTAKEMYRSFYPIHKTLELVLAKYRYKDNSNFKLFFNKKLRYGLLIDVISKFVGTNGYVTKIDSCFKDTKQKKALFVWLKNNPVMVNPKMEKVLDSIMKNSK